MTRAALVGALWRLGHPRRASPGPPQVVPGLLPPLCGPTSFRSERWERRAAPPPAPTPSRPFLWRRCWETALSLPSTGLCGAFRGFVASYEILVFCRAAFVIAVSQACDPRFRLPGPINSFLLIVPSFFSPGSQRLLRAEVLLRYNFGKVEVGLSFP